MHVDSYLLTKGSKDKITFNVIYIMSQFIKLTSMIINKNLVTSIVIKPNKYHIYTVENNINGVMFLGSGGASSSPEKIVICEKLDPQDYEIISKWIDTI